MNPVPLAQLLQARKVRLLGVSGKIGSGKTTLCEAVVHHYGDDRVLVRNFADRLKEEVALHVGVDVDDCYTHDGKNQQLPHYNMTLGSLLQVWGTKIREIHADAWVLAVDAYVREYLHTSYCDETLIVIGDVRFPNEVDWIRASGGHVIRLVGDPAGVRAASTRNVHHASETALDALDGTDAFALTIDTAHCDAHAVLERCTNFIEH